MPSPRLSNIDTCTDKQSERRPAQMFACDARLPQPRDGALRPRRRPLASLATAGERCDADTRMARTMRQIESAAEAVN